MSRAGRVLLVLLWLGSFGGPASSETPAPAGGAGLSAPELLAPAISLPQGTDLLPDRPGSARDSRHALRAAVAAGDRHRETVFLSLVTALPRYAAFHPKRPSARSSGDASVPSH